MNRWLQLMLAGLALLAGNPAARAADCAANVDAVVWPVPDWTVETGTGGPEAVAELERYAFPAGLDESARQGIRTNALLIVRDGRLLYERYNRGFDRETPHIAWSVTKSVVNALIGRAVALGLLSDIEQPAARWISDLATTPKDGMTIADLLNMSSGLAYEEAYEFAPLWSDVIAMLYTRGHADMAAYTATRPLAGLPGRRWSYASGDSVLLMAALRGIVGEAAYRDFPWTALFDPLGMQGAVFERDQAGTFIGSSNLYLRPRDLARFGLLYAADGCWAGQRLLPEGWVEQTGKIAPAQMQPLEGQAFRRGYGLAWWLNHPLADGRRVMLPSAPPDTLIASGHWGQFVLVVPSQGFVLVRNGDDRDGSFSLDPLAALALRAFPAEGAH